MAKTDRDGVTVAFNNFKNLMEMDMSGLDLTGMDLSGANFFQADLAGADLTETTLVATEAADANAKN